MKIIKKNKPSKIKNMKKNIVLSLDQQAKIKGGTEELELAIESWTLNV